MVAIGAPTTHRFDEHYSARLTGANERPIPFEGTGTGMVEVTIGPNNITYSLTVRGLDSPATMAHIHGPGGPNAEASVLIPFMPFAQGVTSGQLAKGTIEGSKLNIPLDSVRKLLKDGLLYVNVHTEGHRSGAIRGQLVPTP
jgi:hypothetical protein